MAANRLTLLLLVLVALLGLQVTVLQRLGIAEVEPVTPIVAAVPPEPSRVVAGEPTPPPLDAFTETVDRPLFTQTRRPPEVAQEASPAIAEEQPTLDRPPPALTLSAVVIEQERSLALLRRTAGETVRLREGEKVDGWTLGEIRPDGVTLVQGESRHELALRTFEPPPPPPRGAAPRRTTLRQRAGQAAQPRPAVRPPRTRNQARAVPRNPTARITRRPRQPLRGPRAHTTQRGPQTATERDN